MIHSLERLRSKSRFSVPLLKTWHSTLWAVTFVTEAVLLDFLLCSSKRQTLQRLVFTVVGHCIECFTSSLLTWVAAELGLPIGFCVLAIIQNDEASYQQHSVFLLGHLPHKTREWWESIDNDQASDPLPSPSVRTITGGHVATFVLLILMGTVVFNYKRLHGVARSILLIVSHEYWLVHVPPICPSNIAFKFHRTLCTISPSSSSSSLARFG
jgi:hypothetical protein